MPSGKAEKTPKADKGAEAPVADSKAAKDSTEKAPKGAETEAKAAKEPSEKAAKAADGETAAKATKEASQGKFVHARVS